MARGGGAPCLTSHTDHGERHRHAVESEIERVEARECVVDSNHAYPGAHHVVHAAQRDVHLARRVRLRDVKQADKHVVDALGEGSGERRHRARERVGDREPEEN